MTITFEHDHLLSERFKKRRASHFSEAPKEGAPPGFTPHPNPLALHWGMPNSGFFPIDQLDISVVEYPFQKSKNLPITNASVESLIPQSKSASTVSVNVIEDSSLIDLKRGLQYSEVGGFPQLRNFTREFIQKVHPPAYSDWDITLSNGAGDGLNKAVEALLDADDVILVEEFTFSPFLSLVAERSGHSVPVKLNISGAKTRGVDVEYLTDLLANWSKHYPHLRKPKAFYTIPSGQNPIGFTQPLETRERIYALAEKYDLIIIEDDPYGYISLPKYEEPGSIVKLNQFLEIDEYLTKHVAPSYLTFDKSGRVLRVETFSKTFAPGLRLGFIVAHKRVIELIINYAHLVTRSPSGPSQIIFQNIIQQKFGGVDGWLNWILKLRATYSHRRDVLLSAFYNSNAYKKGYIDIVDPQAGMFASIVVNIPPNLDLTEKLSLLNWKFLNYGVGVVPGANMAVDKDFSKERSNFYRVTFGPAADDAQLLESGNRFVNAVEDFFEKGFQY